MGSTTDMMQSLRQSLLFSPGDACTGVTNEKDKALCLKNVQPNVDIGESSLFDYYDAVNWTDGNPALSTRPSVYILGSPAAPEHAYIKKLTVAQSVAVAVNAFFADAAKPQLPAFDSGLSMRQLEGALDTFCRHIALSMINISGIGIEVFGNDETSCVEYFAMHGTDASYMNSIQLYSNLTKKDATMTEPTKMTALSAGRVYYAFQFIDHIFPGGDDRFFLADRLVTVTKLLYVCNLLMSARPTAGAAAPQLDLAFLNLMAWLYKRDIEMYVRSDESSDGGLDDMFQRNVKKSQEIRYNSEDLVGKQRTVEGIQTSMRSMENSDRILRRNKRNLTIAYCVMLGLGAALVAGLAYCTATGRVAEMYVTVAVVAVAVLSLEAFKGLQRLLDA